MKKERPTIKLCPACTLLRNIDSFSVRYISKHTGKAVRNTYCNLCMSGRMKDWAKNNRDRFLSTQSRLQRKYNKQRNVKKIQ
jgi:hypothetical protein